MRVTPTATERYEKAKEQIARQVAAFRRTNRDSDETLSIAHEAFIDACLTYRRRKGSFTRWLALKVNKALRQELRKRLRRKGIARMINLNLRSVGHRMFLARNDWRGEPLSQDAQDLIGLALEAGGSGMNRKAVRRVIEETTAGAGWNKSRLINAISEIKKSLCEG